MAITMKTLSVTAFGVMLMVASCSALNCWTCSKGIGSSNQDEKCGENFDSSGSKVVSDLCGSHGFTLPAGMKWDCMKMNTVSGSTSQFARACLPVASTQTNKCFKVEELDNSQEGLAIKAMSVNLVTGYFGAYPAGTGDICVCDGDNCNGSSSVKFTALLIGICMALSLVW